MSNEDIKNPAAISEITSGFDYDEDITIAASETDLDTETVITGFTVERSTCYCRGFCNTTDSNLTVKYQLHGQTGSAFRSIVLNPGQQYIAYVNISAFGGTGNGATAGVLKIYWKKREFFNILLNDRL